MQKKSEVLFFGLCSLVETTIELVNIKNYGLDKNKLYKFLVRSYKRNLNRFGTILNQQIELG